jgi:hypothetical protein
VKHDVAVILTFKEIVLLYYYGRDFKSTNDVCHVFDDGNVAKVSVTSEGDEAG